VFTAFSAANATAGTPGSEPGLTEETEINFLMERSYGQLRIDQGHIEAERATKRSTQNVDVNKPQLTHLFAENREAKAQKVAETAPTDTAEAAKAAVDGTTAKPKLGQKRTFDDATGGKTKSTKKGAISKKEVAPAVLFSSGVPVPFAYTEDCKERGQIIPLDLALPANHGICRGLQKHADPANQRCSYGPL
jgi:hypothetical protein